MKLENYLNDGASWQAQMVLAYLRAHNCKEWNIQVGRYENCREQGYVFTLISDDYKNRRNYAVYEHRNCDNIIVLISDKFTSSTPTCEEMWADKPKNASSHDYDKGFKYDEAYECAEFILDNMEETIKSWNND